MPAIDLWPDFKIEPKPRGIRQVLEEAGEGLKLKTKGFVEFRVFPTQISDPVLPFRYVCSLFVPKIDYSFFLLEVDASPTGYPVELRTDEQATVFEDEASLLAALGTTFRSQRTVAVIQNLISMATE